jgi:hypothetical protein
VRNGNTSSWFGPPPGERVTGRTHRSQVTCAYLLENR